ncbi:Holliday junction branch migration protein RuvA [Syntrophomonas palmitatica]|uniref:Holliday junction branch migration protein RuvA n=1 Tax=Syntrophomonas palmitatica TaxID=402877 RepID=UPI0006CF9A88|nr:Holliday junction branch migration protein RuvA [Syntrophomonas palmitatica]
MIAYIRGILLEKQESRVIIDVQGLGYEVVVHSRNAASLPQLGSIVVLHTHFQVLENECKIYGFSKREELSLFKTLLGVSGMGAKGAMNILDFMDPDQFFQAVASQDLKLLTKIPGIGKKSAERLLFELKDKVEALLPGVQESGNEVWLNDVLEALESLGYQRAEVFPLVLHLKSEGCLTDNAADNIKLVLQARAQQIKK